MHNEWMIKGTVHNPDYLFRLSPKNRLQGYTHKHRTCVPHAQHLLMVDSCGQQWSGTYGSSGRLCALLQIVNHVTSFDPLDMWNTFPPLPTCETPSPRHVTPRPPPCETPHPPPPKHVKPLPPPKL